MSTKHELGTPVFVPANAPLFVVTVKLGALWTVSTTVLEFVEYWTPLVSVYVADAVFEIVVPAAVAAAAGWTLPASAQQTNAAAAKPAAARAIEKNQGFIGLFSLLVTARRADAPALARRYTRGWQWSLHPD